MSLSPTPNSRTNTTPWLWSLMAFLGMQAKALAVSNDTQSLTGFPPCDALMAANLSHIVQLPESPRYPELVLGSWTMDTQRQPWCFVSPSSPTEVAQTIIALRSAGEGAGDWHVAVRSGGHGSDYQSSIDQGVTIDLTQLNATTYNPATNIASLGTGARWGDVYAELERKGVLVTGGREGVVGVGGLTLGGGVSWYSARTGFTCDSVINYEVVLADGRIINANATSHSDLWRALKGGSSNFGIVTRFDVEAFPATNLWTEQRVYAAEHANELIDAVAGFTDLDRSFQDNALISITTYSAEAGTTIALTLLNTLNDSNTTAFDAFKRIPTLKPSIKKSVTLAESANSTELGANTLNVGAGEITFVNDPRVMRFCVDQFADLVTDLKSFLGPQNFTTILDFQPFPSYFADIGVEKGGNMLGIEGDSRNKIFFITGVTLLTPDSQSKYSQVNQKLAAMMRRVNTFANAIGKGVDFTYLPYADAAQDPLGSYGDANVKYMKEVARKYDPTCFFQRMVSGGFKINRVN